MIEPYETEKQCRVCHECKPLSDYYPGRGPCRKCLTSQTRKRRIAVEGGAPKVERLEPAVVIPKHEYTEIDRVWMAACLPADRSRPLRLSA